MDASLAEELSEVQYVNRRCIERFVHHYGEENRDTIVAVINHDGPATQLSNLLKRRGITVSSKAILAHRNNQCGCPQ